MSIDPIIYNLRYHAEKHADEQETCEQKRAREYGIDPLDCNDPTTYNALTIDPPKGQ
jgi:hypothetical protein